MLMMSLGERVDGIRGGKDTESKRTVEGVFEALSTRLLPKWRFWVMLYKTLAV
jgi:hypothetical protein